MILKIGVTLVVLSTIIQLYRAYRKEKLNIIVFTFWFSVWTALEVIVIYPYSTVYLAQLLNFEFGINAVVALSVIVLFYLLFNLYLKYEELKSKMVHMVRNQALRDVEKIQD